MRLATRNTYTTKVWLKSGTAFVLLCLLLLCAESLFGQADTGTITGTVTDASHAVVPAATVTIVATETNSRRTVATNSAGRYSSGPLPVGSYQVEVRAKGFKNLVRSGLTLQVQQTAVVDAQMEVGDTTQQMTVTGAVDLVNTTDASQGQVIDARSVAALPLNGRDYLQLALLSEGAMEGPGADRSASGANNGVDSRAGGFRRVLFR